ncbi:Uncharacterised protein [Sphingobacterium thalpophilum]|uniref:Uncharacterized protein n=1 Tax=Sphingobacterium thalpophilum TaxID=259 RepID=A0A4U9VIN1_9SPHI|nr:Uncharacterised protein [Sphingobacterium thalpophilum]
MEKYSIGNGNRVKRNFSTSSHYRINLKKTNQNKFHNAKK